MSFISTSCLQKLQNHIKNLHISKIKVTASASTFDTLHDVRQMAQLWIEPYVRVRNNFQRTHLVQSTRLCYCLWGYCNLVLNTFKVKSTMFFFITLSYSAINPYKCCLLSRNVNEYSSTWLSVNHTHHRLIFFVNYSLLS